MTPTWKVVLSQEARADIRAFEKSDIALILKGLDKLETEPLLRGHSLKGNLGQFRSLVVGNRKIRVIYEVINDEVLVYVIAIGHRRDDEVYVLASRRLDPKWR